MTNIALWLALRLAKCFSSHMLTGVSQRPEFYFQNRNSRANASYFNEYSLNHFCYLPSSWVMSENVSLAWVLIRNSCWMLTLHHLSGAKWHRVDVLTEVHLSSSTYLPVSTCWLNIFVCRLSPVDILVLMKSLVFVVKRDQGTRRISQWQRFYCILLQHASR